MRDKEHQPQHKNRRKEAKGKELSDLKRENNKLKRQLARATKELTKHLDREPPEEENHKPTQEPKIVSKVACDNCRSENIKMARLPTGNLVVCTICGWRKKQ